MRRPAPQDAPMRRCWLIVLWMTLGCSKSTPPAADPDPPPRLITDSLGRKVPIHGTPRRVLSLAPSNTEWVFALGLGDRLVGRTSACDHPADAAQVPSIGSLFPPDLERISLTRPDLVLMIDGAAKVRAHFERTGVPVLVLQPRTLAELQTHALLLGTALDEQARGKALAASLQPAVPPTGGPTAIYLASAEPAYAAGPRTFIADMLRHAGARPLDLKLPGDWPQVPLERLALAKPDVIIAADAKVAAAIRAGGAPWAAIGARVIHPPDADWLARAGPRVQQGMAWLRDALRP